MPFDTFARISVLILHIIRFAYWFISEKSANKEKPFLTKTRVSDLAKRGATLLLGVLLATQLLGLKIFPFTNSILVQSFGLAITFVGIGISLAARKNLGTNWAHAAQYQIKTHHTLITNGIYKYIRHPIYIGMGLAYVGGELVAGSWLFLPLMITLALISKRQAKKEEQILLEKFGDDYKKYQKTSAKFIPFVY